jgi:hypothetical protein
MPKTPTKRVREEEIEPPVTFERNVTLRVTIKHIDTGYGCTAKTAYYECVDEDGRVAHGAVANAAVDYDKDGNACVLCLDPDLTAGEQPVTFYMAAKPEHKVETQVDEDVGELSEKENNFNA